MATTVRMTRAERQARTRSDLVDAAERLFTSRGFHATSVDAVADEAGYTKGAVYSNFASKEDLFFAVYERRSARASALVEDALAGSTEVGDAVEAIARGSIERRQGDDGWLAVFFEFWAHVLRHPELRERFADLHAKPIEPLIAATERVLRDRGHEPPDSLGRDVTAAWVMQLGLQIERLTRPDVVDAGLAAREARRTFEAVVEGGTDGSRVQAQAARGRRRRPA
jgi:AcrR family transcriptional regulator